MAVDPIVPLATFAAMIGLGFLGYLLFERTRITDVLILMAFGAIVGPWLGIFDVAGFQEASALVGTLALIIIMFDGGLGLDLKDLISGLGKSTLLAVSGFVLTVAAIAYVGNAWMDLPWMTAILLGTILGGTSGVIVMPLINQITARTATRVTLSVESALTDVLCVIGAVTMMGLIAGAGVTGATNVGTPELHGAAKDVAAQFSIAIVIGLVIGLMWLRLLKWLQNKKYSYMLTLAAVLGLFTGSEAFGGNGAIAVLIFGIVLGNGVKLARMLEFEGNAFNHNQKQFQSEITFLIRVFFFVYLGVILDPTILLNTGFLVVSLLIVAAIVLARALAVILAGRDPGTRGDRGLITFLMPRGLAATVLAGLPLAAGIPGTENFLAIAFIVVAVTNLVGTAAVMIHERAAKRRALIGGAAVAGAVFGRR